MRKNTKVIIYNNPLEKKSNNVFYCKPGFTINDLNIDKENYVFYVNGKPCDFNYKLKAKDILSIYITPKDTDNSYVRQGIKIAAILAVAALTQNWTSTWKMAALLSTNLIANYLLPDLPGDETVPEELLSGTLTEPKANLRIPKIFGNVNFTPPMAARPHLNPGSGNDASLVYCVALGYGPLDLIGTSTSLQLSGTRTTPYILADIPDGSITLGGTDIKQAKGVSIEIGDPNTFTLYDELVYDQVVNFSYTRTTGRENGWLTDNVEHIQTTGVAGKNITINLHFPSGFYTKGGDNKVNKAWQDAIEFRVLYKKPADTTWTAFTLPSKYTNFSTKDTDNTYGWFQGGKTNPFWVKLNFTLPTEDTYDIKVVRVRTWTADSEVVRATFVWETLVVTKSGQPIKQLYSPKVDSGEEPIWMAIKIKGKDRIKSAYDLKVNLGGYCFNGTAKVRTQSPALAALEILTTSANKNRIDPSKIDVNSFTAWDNWCSTVGYTFNTAYYKDETFKTVLDDASRAGLGRVIITDQGFRAVYDSGAANTTPTQLFTSRNAWNFSATQSADKIPDAIKIAFLNEDTYTQDAVIIYNTGYDETTAFDISDYSFRGITKHDHAASIASFLLNTAILRPTTYKFTTTIEALRSIVGDKVKLQHDSIAVGYGSGRVIETTTSGTNITSVKLDENIILGGAASGDNSILFRASDGTIYISQITEFNVETNTFTLSNPISNTVNLLDAIATVGKTSQETIDLVISDIEYSNDFSATITGFDAAPEVHNHSGKIPPYTPPAYLPPNPEQLTPPVPTIVSAYASVEDSDTLPDGTPLAELKALFKAATNSVQIDYIEVQIWADSSIDSQGEPQTFKVGPWEGLSVKVGFEDNIYMRARSISPYGKTSDWTDLQTITPTWTWPPSVVTNLQIENFDDKVRIYWDKHPRISVKEYEVRRGTIWDTATILGRTTDTFFIDYAQGIGNTTYFVAPIDNTTNEIGAISSASLTVTNPLVSNLTSSIIQNRVKLSWTTTPGTWPIDKHEIVINGDEINKIEINGNNNSYWLNDLSLGQHTITVRAVSIVGAAHEQSITIDIIDRPVGTADDSGVFVRNWETDVQINELPNPYYGTITKSNLGRNGGTCLDIGTAGNGKHSHYISSWASALLPDKVQTALLAKRVRFQSYIKSKDGTTSPSGGNIIYWDANLLDDVMTTGNSEYSGNGYPFFIETLYDVNNPDNYIVRPGDVLTIQAELKVDATAQTAGADSRIYAYIIGKSKIDGSLAGIDSVAYYSTSTTYETVTFNFVTANDTAINDYTVESINIAVYHYPSSITDGLAYARNIKATINGKAFSISTQNSNTTDDWINIGDIVKIPSYATNIKYGVAPSHERSDGNGCLLDDFSIFPVPDKIDSNNIEQWISKAAIGDAYISSLIADKIKSGTINSEIIYVGDQSIQIDGSNNWILIKDKQGTPKSRVVLGKTGPGATDYGITIYDANGNILLGTNRSFDSSLVDALSTQNAPAEPGADVTGNNTAADTSNVAGTPANTVRDNAASGASAWAKFSGAGNTLPSGEVEFNFAASSTKGGNALNTDAVGNYAAADVEASVLNYNTRNDRNNKPLTTPVVTAGAITYTINTDGSANVSFQWGYAGIENDIDGFIVYAYRSDTAGVRTIDGTEPAYYVTPRHRAFTLEGVPADAYYQFGVRSYRIVDPDVAPGGVLLSNIVQDGTTLYQPSTNVAFQGVVGGATYSDGTSIDSLQPREASADNTGNRIYGTGGLLPNWNLDIIDGEGKPAGIQPVESVADRNGISATPEGLRIQHPTDDFVGYGFPAIPIDDMQRYRVVITHRSDQTTTNGLYLRFNELNAALNQGKTHIGLAAGGAATQVRTSWKDFLGNGPMPGPTWVVDEYIYTPTPGTKFASFSMYNWGYATTIGYEVDRVQIIPIAKTASDIEYSDGTVVDALKPKEPNADTTKGAIESVVTINDQGAIQNASWDTGTKKIKIDFANQRIAIGDDVYGGSTPHILQEYNAGSPRFELTAGGGRFFRMDAQAGEFELGPEVKTNDAGGYFSDAFYYTTHFDSVDGLKKDPSNQQLVLATAPGYIRIITDPNVASDYSVSRDFYVYDGPSGGQDFKCLLKTFLSVNTPSLVDVFFSWDGGSNSYAKAQIDGANARARVVLSINGSLYYSAFVAFDTATENVVEVSMTTDTAANTTTGFIRVGSNVASVTGGGIPTYISRRWQITVYNPAPDTGSAYVYWLKMLSFRFVR